MKAANLSAGLTTELAPEDALRLHVLLAGGVQAIRLDESAPALHALTERGEAKISLHPNCRAEQYLMRVRELLGGHALGSPGGYPVHLRRWTRMGQASPKSLEAMLLLGEAEAVVAVAHTQGLTDELARRVWWIQPSFEVARAMLAHPGVARGTMARTLADYLIEHLPFVEDPLVALNGVRAVLAAGQPDAAGRQALWQKAKRRPHYFVGFLESLPDALPGDLPARPCDAALTALAEAGNLWARQLRRAYSASGQSFLKAAELALEKPAVPDAVYALLDAIGAWCAPLNVAEGRAQLVTTLPEQAPAVGALAVLAATRASDAEPILTRSSAVGPHMRKKLEPLIAPLLNQLRALQ
ncbi:MAG: hypothetical protein HY066_04030 [Betaproteobacteria bacterium]|nr:hypothetical protein [Betaproteobacteria bacterium]